jgi:hypothetical protein
LFAVAEGKDIAVTVLDTQGLATTADRLTVTRVVVVFVLSTVREFFSDFPTAHQLTFVVMDDCPTVGGQA